MFKFIRLSKRSVVPDVSINGQPVGRADLVLKGMLEKRRETRILRSSEFLEMGSSFQAHADSVGKIPGRLAEAKAGHESGFRARKEAVEKAGEALLAELRNTDKGTLGRRRKLLGQLVAAANEFIAKERECCAAANGILQGARPELGDVEVLERKLAADLREGNCFDVTALELELGKLEEELKGLKKPKYVYSRGNMDDIKKRRRHQKRNGLGGGAIAPPGGMGSIRKYVARRSSNIITGSDMIDAVKKDRWESDAAYGERWNQYKKRKGEIISRMREIRVELALAGAVGDGMKGQLEEADSVPKDALSLEAGDVVQRFSRVVEKLNRQVAWVQGNISEISKEDVVEKQVGDILETVSKIGDACSTAFRNAEENTERVLQRINENVLRTNRASDREVGIALFIKSQLMNGLFESTEA